MTRRSRRIDLDACPFACVALILTVIAAVFVYQVPKGVLVKLAERVNTCGDGPEDTVLTLASDGSVQINARSIGQNSLATALQDTFRGRTARVIYVNADADVSFQEVVSLIDSVRLHCDYVAIITPATDTREGCLNLALPGLHITAIHAPKVELKRVPLWP